MANITYSCFLEAARTLNFTTAASNLFITQPALSRNIAALEEELGFKLFWRSKQNGLRITPAGLAFYNGLNKVSKQYNDIVEQAKRIGRGQEGKIVISILNGTKVESKIFRVLRQFEEKYPDVEVTLRAYNYADLVKSVEMGWSDIGIGVQMAVFDRDHILSEPVYNQPSYLAVPSRLKCDINKTYDLIDFKNETFIFSEDAKELNDMFLETCRNAGFEPKTKLAPDHETKMLWAELGLGLAANNKEHYISKSEFVDFVKVNELKDVTCVAFWDKENFNPAISLFHSLFNNIE